MYSPERGDCSEGDVTPSKYRTSLDCRLSVDGLKVLEDPLVIQLVTENELMLMEIEELRRRVRVQDVEIAAMKQKSSSEEVANIHELESIMLQHDKQVDEIRERDSKKVGLLRPILETLARIQFEMGYYVREKSVLEADNDDREAQSRPQTPSSSRTSSSLTMAVQQPTTLADANARYEQLYHLISSYQATPSFMSSPYDALVLDALNHIIALSKTMNALVFASAEQLSNTDVSAVAVSPPPAPPAPPEERKSRSSSIWEAITRGRAT